MLKGYGNRVLLWVVFLSLAGWGHAALASNVQGVWLTKEGKSKVKIFDCGGKLCGTIVWLAEPLNDQGAAKVDQMNPDAGLRERPIVGLPLLDGFVAGDEENYWVDGTIYNPEDGETYSCTMRLQEDGTLKVHGYVGLPLFGKSQIWTREP